MSKQTKQTAVEWLFLMINNPNDNQSMALKCFEKAKAMEKEQICNAMDVGFDEGSEFIEDIKYNNAEDYYNKTYKEDKQ